MNTLIELEKFSTQVITILPRRLTIFFLLLALIFVPSACQGINTDHVRGSGNVVSEERLVVDFDQVLIGGGLRLHLIQGDVESLVIEAEDNLMEYITSEVINNQLIVKFKSGVNINTTKSVNVYVSMTEIRGIDLSEGSHGEVESVVTGDLALNLSGGSGLAIDALIADSLIANLSGGSNVELAGEVSNQNFTISGCGDYNAFVLLTQSTEANLSGGASGTVWASESLSASLSGASNLNYYGSPSLSQNVSGGGSLSALGDK